MNAPETIPLQILVEEALAMAAGRLAARGVVASVAPDLPAVRGDHQRILDVLVT